MATQVLEINLISAQGLKEPKARRRRMQTYALAWVDQCTKLRTRVDRVGNDNPTWNDKFFFRVSPDFLSRETSGVSIEIYSVGCLRDHLIGSVRFLVSNFLPRPTATKNTSSFNALQIRRPSGTFKGILNIGAMVIDGSYFLATRSGMDAIGYGDLRKETLRGRFRHSRKSKPMVTEYADGKHCRENSTESKSVDYSDSPVSTTSSSSSTSTPFKERNGVRELAGKNNVSSSSKSGSMLCCFFMHRKRP